MAIHDDAMLILAHDIGQPCPPAVGTALQELYRLTTAEARVACLVGMGLSPASAAQKLNIAEATARSELKHVFEKLGVRRQGELVSLVTRLISITSSTH
jgi:DNA-binding CsgD family transcriptional regulator